RGCEAKQPCAIATKDGSPFGIAGISENWKEPAFGEWIRTFAVITTDANELVAEIHDRMPAILAPADYGRWLSDEPDPPDPMRPSPISTRVWRTTTTPGSSSRSSWPRMPLETVGLGSQRDPWGQRVVPSRTNVMGGEREFLQLSVRNRPTFPVDFLIEMS